VALVLVCAAVAGALFQSSTQRISVVVAAKSMPAGAVLTPSDLGTASIPASSHITAMSSIGSSALVGQQLDTPVYAGQVMVKQMLSSAPQLASGEQVVGMLLKGDQMPSVPLVAGDTVEVIAVPQPGQGSTIGATFGSTLVASATVFAVGPAPINQTQYQASLSLEVPGVDAATVTSYAAADQIGLSLVAEGTK
jgi:Flp pilus assembly protein CpaB